MKPRPLCLLSLTYIANNVHLVQQSSTDRLLQQQQNPRGSLIIPVLQHTMADQ